MVAVNQTITIVNKSGKIVSTSKHLVNVFNEAKSAYNERKAEIKAQRKGAQEAKNKQRKVNKQLEALTLVDDDSDDVASRRSSRHTDEDFRVKRKPVPTPAHDRPVVERGVSDSFYANHELYEPPRGSQRPSPLHHGSFDDGGQRIGELARRNTDGMQLKDQRPPHARRRVSLDDIDMDLAYGELPPPLPQTRLEDEVELRSKMNYLQRLLDEGNCVQHSVTAMIDNLQKNPEALAAVALTLAEISNIVAKMAPGALTTLKSSFPVIVALLASPQFAIAVGVGVGVTIIAFGGYKIIKKIKARDEARLLERGSDPASAEGLGDDGDQLRELTRIETWRRGIAEAEASSAGTGVDGEFTTPAATRTLLEQGRLTEADLKPLQGDKKSRRKKTKSEASSKSKSKKSKAKKEPSVLRSLFKGHS